MMFLLVTKQLRRNKFQTFKKNVHVADNANHANNAIHDDKMEIIRPLIDFVNESLQQFGIFEKQLSIDV